jgi:hypothetical protein
MVGAKKIINFNILSKGIIAIMPKHYDSVVGLNDSVTGDSVDLCSSVGDGNDFPFPNQSHDLFVVHGFSVEYFPFLSLQVFSACWVEVIHIFRVHIHKSASFP